MLKQLLTISLLTFTVCACANDQTDLLADFKKDGAEKIKLLAMQLKQELTTAMQSGGPVQAVSTCHIKAPEVTDALNKEAPIQIRRTSLKLRNTNNQPDNWEQEVLQKFEQQLKDGTPASELVHAEKIESDSTITLRMMKAIPTQGICLTCHGSEQTLAPEVLSTIKTNYPNDRATDYSVGEIRGAFSLTQTINN